MNKLRNVTHWYDPCVFLQNPSCLHGFAIHSSTSSAQFGPLNPIGHSHLYFSLPIEMHLPPLEHGDEAHGFGVSQWIPR